MELGVQRGEEKTLGRKVPRRGENPRLRNAPEGIWKPWKWPIFRAVVDRWSRLSLRTSIMFKGCSASVQGPREENLGSTARELVLEHTIVTIPLRRYDTELWWSRSTFRTIRNYIPIITVMSIIPLIRATFIAANHAQIALSQKTIVWISRGRKRC